MSLTDELYRETILDHYHHPRNQGELNDATIKIEGVNPLCGDEITLYFNADDKTLSDVKINSHGCSINTASGSIMTECVKGQSLDNVKEVINTFKTMMLSKEDNTELSEELEDLECLRGVKKYPVRIKCALLPWNTLQQGLERLSSGKTDTQDQYVEK
ncbi:MAG: SUF system NifU family Fe-S cluster assembly protein [Candidatus Obscuribacterales bacterium]|nr:SUF system NifU family Fe-S cluster assembly protein [Candidatus Obscuribacterales bacterium]